MNRSGVRGRVSGTLVNAVVLLLGIALIVALVVPQFTNSRRITTINLPAAQIAGLTNYIERFRADCGRFPASLEDLLTKPDGVEFSGWRGPYLKKPTVDPWGHPLNYRVPGTHNPDGFDLWSLGPDGEDGTSDDSTNWPLSK